MRREVVYAGYMIIFEFDEHDRTGEGSINEIVTRDEYMLSKYQNCENKIFIDIGAAIGVASVIIAKLNPKSRVLAFEPYEKSYSAVLKNAELNGLTNLEVYNLAVTKSSIKEMMLHICNDMSGANSTYADSSKFEKKYKKNRVSKIEAISLDEIVEKNKIESIELLKIDCEGAEFDIIYDSEYFKKGIVKNMTGEFHDLSYNNAMNKSDDLLKYCKNFVPGNINICILRI